MELVRCVHGCGPRGRDAELPALGHLLHREPAPERPVRRPRRQDRKRATDAGSIVDEPATHNRVIPGTERASEEEEKMADAPGGGPRRRRRLVVAIAFALAPLAACGSGTTGLVG